LSSTGFFDSSCQFVKLVKDHKVYKRFFVREKELKINISFGKCSLVNSVRNILFSFNYVGFSFRFRDNHFQDRQIFLSIHPFFANHFREIIVSSNVNLNIIVGFKVNFVIAESL